MNILQIHIGKKPSKERIECMKSVLKNLRKNDVYFLISTTDFLKDKRVNHIDYKKYVTKMNKNKDIKKVWNKIPKTIDKHCLRSDLIRFNYLSEHKDTLYIDTDVKLSEVPKVDKDKTYFSKYNKLFDYFMMYGDTKLFKDILNRTLYSTINLPYFFPIVNHKRFINKYDTFDNTLFQHLDID